MFRWLKKLFSGSPPLSQRAASGARRGGGGVPSGASLGTTPPEGPDRRGSRPAPPAADTKASSALRPAPRQLSDLEQGRLQFGEPRQGDLFRSQAYRSSTSATSKDVVAVTIGLDFGTHSTKVVLRKELDEHGELMILAPPADNTKTYDPHADAPFPWFALPSVVGIGDGQFLFGEEARSLPPDDRHFALKATLVKGVPPVASNFLRQLGSGSEEAAVDELAVAYVSWVLQRLRHALNSRFGQGKWRPFVAMGAPMDRYEDEALKRRFERILGAAFRAALQPERPAIDPQWPLEGSLGRIRALLDEPEPDKRERQYEVLPEAVAAMVPLSRDPRWSGGLFNVIDIGGGTTELSVVHLATDPAPVIDCRGDQSIPSGGIALRAFEDGKSPEDPLEEIRKTLNRVWCEAHDLDWKSSRHRSPWRRNTILKAGGGWGKGRVERFLDEKHPSRDYYGPPNNSSNDFHLHLALYEPSAEVLRVDKAAWHERVPNPEERHFLPVALGLCFFPDWPDWYRPSEAKLAPPDPQDLIPIDPFHGHA